MTHNQKVRSADKILVSDKTQCSIHPDEDVAMFCKACSKLICHECLTSGSHLSHKLGKLEDVIKENAKELPSIVNQSYVMINTGKDRLNLLEENQGMNSKQISAVVEEISTRNSLLKDKLDNITAEFIADIQKLHSNNKEITKTCQRHIEEEITLLKDLTEQCELQQDGKQLKFIQLVRETKQKLEDLKPFNPPELTPPPLFVAEAVHEQEIKVIFGDLHFISEQSKQYQELSPTLSYQMPSPRCDEVVNLQSFKTSDHPNFKLPSVLIDKGAPIFEKEAGYQNFNAIIDDLDGESGTTKHFQNVQTTPTDQLLHQSYDVEVIKNFQLQNMGYNEGVLTATNDNKVWLFETGGKTCRLITVEGLEMRRMTADFSVCDLTVTESGELIATVDHGCAVKKLIPNGPLVGLWDGEDSEYMTSGISATDSNDIVVSLYKFTDELGMFGKYQYKVIYLSSFGHFIRTVLQYESPCIVQNVAFPCNICINRNGDIILGLKEEGSVLIIYKDGGQIITYKGKVEGLKYNFSPCYTVADGSGHIMVSDYDNSVIHLLDKYGNFKKLVITGKDGLGYPHGLTIDTSGRLWIWHKKKKDEKIMILKYSTLVL